MGGTNDKERYRKAVNAMKDLGISEKRVSEVLKKLFRLYDKNWEPIEDENYRVLADAIFEQENEVENSIDNMEAPFQDELGVPPLKRRLRSQADVASPSSETPLKRSKIREADLPLVQKIRSVEHEATQSHMNDDDEQETPISPQSFSRVDSEEPSQLCLRDRTDRASQHIKSKGKEPVFSSSTCPGDDTADPNSLQKQFKEKQTEHNSPQRTNRLPVRSSFGVCFKEPKVEPGIILLRKEKFTNSRQNEGLIKPKSEPAEDFIPFEIPLAVMPPASPDRTNNDDSLRRDGCSTLSGCTGQVNGADIQPVCVSTVSVNGAEGLSVNGCIGRAKGADCSTVSGSTGQANGEDSMTSKDKQDGISGRGCKAATSSELANVPDTSKSFEIASSPLGEVKISLTCNQALEQPDFRLPSLNAVLNAVEDRCLRSFRILDPNFSMIKLMEEMCKSYLELSNKAPDPKEDSLIHLSSDFNFLKNSNLRKVLSGEGGIRMPTSLHSSDEVVLPETPSILLLEGPNCHHKEKGDGNINGEMYVDGFDSNSSDSRGLVVIPQHVSTIGVGPRHDVNDISKGEERVRISLINEVTSESFAHPFYYIPKNIVYQNAYLSFSLARIGDEDCCSTCFGDCLSSSIPCACARETGGEFAYTLEGLVKEEFLDECISMNRDPPQHRHYYCKECPLERSKEGICDPCKGHLVRKFIKECWSKCGCNMQCGNRVVQRGIACNLQVFMTSEGKGWGLRTLEDLPKGAFICEYVGEVLTNTELYERNIQSTGKEKHTYPVLLDADWGSEGVLKDEEALCLDATYYGNVARFINHRCSDATMVEIPVEVETPDHHYYHLAFFTTRKVDALEELTWDYGIDFNDHSHPVKAFRCQCQSKCCRDMKRSHRTKSRR
ncbi:Histone-lysine n-methyltransferase suvr4 [Thalictrum thalictroides]|uniref:Histone-lysine n-methyltransferase suvr4 n=1 Tax=Thalictrum thalictroides TaxID=46969 RepID=A0A7J6VSY9_THATH|nr:Histone-lysine n-methyltransferase suvr4 [Thalictrum thalictroides]